MTPAKARSLPTPTSRVAAALTFERRGSTWLCTYKDRAQWPLFLIARRVYYGTGRTLATLTLARDVGDDTKAMSILTGQMDFQVITRRRDFAKEAAKRLKDTIEGSVEALDVTISAMLDALGERLLLAQNEVEEYDATDISLPIDLTPPYAVWPLVPQQRPGMLIAPSGTGKSGLALMLGLSVVTGKTIVERIEPRMQGPVMYIGQEDDKEQWAARLAMICRGHGIQMPKGYYYMRLIGASLIDSAPVIAERAAGKGAALIIVDSAQATWGTEGESVRGYATQWYNAIAELEAPTLIIEHPNLVNTLRGVSTQASGSGVKQDRVGHQWGMRSLALPSDDGEAYRYHVTLSDSKRNYVARQPDIDLVTMVYRHDWMRFVASEALTVETVVNTGSHNDDALAARMWSSKMDNDEEHVEGWLVSELKEKLKLRDDRRLRISLEADHWRPAKWNAGLQYMFGQVEGTGTNSRSNPAKYELITRPAEDPEEPYAVPMSTAPGDPDGFEQ